MIRPKVDIARQIAKVAPGEIVEILGILGEGLLDVAEGLKPQMDRYHKLNAANFFTHPAISTLPSPMRVHCIAAPSGVRQTALSRTWEVST